MKQQFAMVPVEQIRITDNVRTKPGDVTDLVESIRRFGILEPLVGCPTQDRDAIDLLMGQRRFVAAKEAGLDEVPMILRLRPSERDRVLMQLAENLERADMSPIDEALAYRELTQTMRQADIAKVIRRSQAHISRRLRLLQLPETVRVAVDLAWVTEGAVMAVPWDLWSDGEAVAALAPKLSGGDKALRWWVKEQLDKRGGSAADSAYREMRAINVPLAVWEQARMAGVELGLSTNAWAAKVLEAAAAEVLEP